MTSFLPQTLRPSHYPIEIREEYGSLHICSRDFQIHQFEKIPKGGLTPAQIFAAIEGVWRKIAFQMQQRTAQNKLLPPLPPPPATPKLEQTIGIKDAVQLSGLSPSTLRRMVASGELKASKTPGGHRRFLYTEIAALSVPQDTRRGSGGGLG